MICIQKMYGSQGLNHQIIEERWDATPMTYIRTYIQCSELNQKPQFGSSICSCQSISKWIGESLVFYKCKALKLVLVEMKSNCDEKAHLRFSVTMSEPKTNECCSPPSAGKFTFASFQVIPWSPSSFHKRLVPLPLLQNNGHSKLNPTILLLTETSASACQSRPRA